MYLNDRSHLANLSAFSAKPVASQLSFLLPVVYRASQGALVMKNLPVSAGDIEIWIRPLGWADPLEEGVATCSSIHAWRISWTEVPGRLLSIGSHRAGHD